VEALSKLGAPSRPADSLEEMARLVRLQWRAHDLAWAAESRRVAAAEANEHLLAENQRLEAENRSLRQHIAERVPRLGPALKRQLGDLGRRRPPS
jgi:hypothetical protein